MKKYILSFLALPLILSGCGRSRPTPPPQGQPFPIYQTGTSSPTSPSYTTSSSTPDPTQLTSEDLNQRSEYFQIRKELQKNNKNGYNLYIYAPQTPDCYGSENGQIYSEDLLHLLTSNDTARSIMKPKVYTKEYTKKLQDQIIKYNNDVQESPVSIFYLCHLGKDIDILGGKYFFDGREAESKFDTVRNNEREQIMFLFSKGKMYPIKNLQMLDSTATGGEVYPCKAKLNSTHIVWTCFTGLDEDPKTNATFGTYRDTKISLDGRILSIEDKEDK